MQICSFSSFIAVRIGKLYNLPPYIWHSHKTSFFVSARIFPTPRITFAWVFERFRSASSEVQVYLLDKLTLAARFGPSNVQQGNTLPRERKSRAQSEVARHASPASN